MQNIFIRGESRHGKLTALLTTVGNIPLYFLILSSLEIFQT